MGKRTSFNYQGFNDSTDINHNTLYNYLISCIRILKFNTAVIYFFDTINECFFANYYYGLSRESFESLRVLPTDGMCGQVISTKRTQILGNHAYLEDIRPQLKKEEFLSSIAVPIRDKHNIKGVLIASAKKHKSFDKYDIDFMESLGLQIGVADELSLLLQQKKSDIQIDTNNKLEKLTTREKEILQLASEGMTNKEMSSVLHISNDTVKDYLTNTLRKLRCKNRTEAVARAIRYTLI